MQPKRKISHEVCIYPVMGFLAKKNLKIKMLKWFSNPIAEPCHAIISFNFLCSHWSNKCEGLHIT